MELYRKILVALDLSKLSTQTLEKAVLLSRQFTAEVHVMHAVEYLPALAYDFIEHTDINSVVIAEARKELHDIAETYGIATDHQHIELGSPKLLIAEKAKALQADLIIVGSHGKHGLARILGSTAASIVSHAERDVMVVYAK